MSEFGEKIRDLRAAQHLKLKEVAGMVGIPESRLNELEKGVRIPTSGQVERLAQCFKVDSGELAKSTN
jgi:transcriptional regulator with XRE-family HTH domain